jgi:hypothetical protein
MKKIKFFALLLALLTISKSFCCFCESAAPEESARTTITDSSNFHEIAIDSNISPLQIDASDHIIDQSEINDILLGTQETDNIITQIAALASGLPQVFADSRIAQNCLEAAYSNQEALKQEIVDTFTRYKDTMRYNDFLNSLLLSFEILPLDQRQNIESSFTQKITIAPQANLTIIGDIHGCWHSLMRHIETIPHDEHYRFTENDYLICLGDYIDRGWYGLETLATLITLKIQNPDRVFLLQGNHESFTTCWGEKDSLAQELSFKFKELDNLDHFKYLLNYVFLSLPSALIVESGTPANSYKMLFCHGGLPAYVNKKNKRIVIENLNTNGTDGYKQYNPIAASEGFRFGDIYSTGCQQSILIPEGFFQTNRALDPSAKIIPCAATEQETLRWMEKNNLMLLFRGHQHNYAPIKLFHKFFGRPIKPDFDGLYSWKELNIPTTPTTANTLAHQLNSIFDIVPIITLSTAVAAGGVQLCEEGFVRLTLTECFEQLRPIFFERRTNPEETFYH